MLATDKKNIDNKTLLSVIKSLYLIRFRHDEAINFIAETITERIPTMLEDEKSWPSKPNKNKMLYSAQTYGIYIWSRLCSLNHDLKD